MTSDIRAVDVLAPNLKRRYSGVTSTVLRLVPIQAGMIGIAAVGPVLPRDIPRIGLLDLLTMPRRGPSGCRAWHARRNVEMLAGLALRHLLRKRLKLMFTSAAQRRHSRYTRWLIRRMDAVVATSDRAAAYLDRPAPVIAHGVDSTLFAPSDDRVGLRRRLGLDPEAVLVGCFGRIRPQKGTDLFVEAMLSLVPDRPGVAAVVMGGVTPAHADFAADLKQRIAAAGLSDRVRILAEDSGSSIAPWFAAMDLYVAPQRWEGFGLTVLEAMSCGVAVVATRVGAFEDLVVDGVTGSLVPPDDGAALAKAIARLLDDAPARAAMATAARSQVLERFRIEHEAAALVAIYRDLLMA